MSSRQGVGTLANRALKLNMQRGKIEALLRLVGRGAKQDIQNIGVAFLIIFTNLPSPEADFAALPLIAVATLTNLPLVLIYFLRKLYKCFRLKGARNKKSPNKYEKDDLEKAAKSEEEAKPMVVAIRI